MDLLQQQLVSVKTETQAAQELQVSALREKEALVQEKEVLMARILQAEMDHKALEKQLEALVFERDRLSQAKQAIERENIASHKLESLLQQELDILKMERDKLLKEGEKAEQIEAIKRDLQEQLSAKSEVADHYKAQVGVSSNNPYRTLTQFNFTICISVCISCFQVKLVDVNIYLLACNYSPVRSTGGVLQLHVHTSVCCQMSSVDKDTNKTFLLLSQCHRWRRQ